MKSKVFLILLSCLLLFSCASTSGVQEEFVVSEKIGFACQYRIPKDYTKAESYRTNAPYSIIVDYVKNNENVRKKDVDEYVENLCKLIKREATNDFEKVKMAHDFATYLLPYDYISLKGNRKWQDWRAVVRNKLGVCEGYARLLKEVCNRVGIKCLYISGYAGYVGDDANYHAWDIVCCEKEWYFVDPTWDSYVDSKTGENIVRTDYLFPRPETFILTHYPTSYETENGVSIGSYKIGDYNLQLLHNPLTIKEHSELLSIYKKEAKTYPAYNKIFEDFYTNIKKDVFIDKNLTLEYKLKPNNMIWINLYEEDSNKVIHRCNTTKENTFNISLKKGTYKTIVYGCNENENYGNALIEFTIHAGAPESKWNVLPTGGIHIPINFGTIKNRPDYTDSEDTANSSENLSVTDTVYEVDLYSAAKKLSFNRNQYSPKNNPNLVTDISINSIVKMNVVKPGDIIRLKGKIETTDPLKNLTGILYDPDPAYGFWKEVATETCLITSADGNSVVEFSQDFVVLYKPKTDFRVQFKLNMGENNNITFTKVKILQ